MVEIIFLGTGNAFGHDGRLPSAYVIKSKDYTTMLDFGPATLSALKKHKIASQSINRIFISHLHADHIMGLAFLVLEDKWVVNRTQPIDIYGPATLKNAVYELTTYHGADIVEHIDSVLNFITLETNEHLILSDGEIYTFPAIHPANAKMMLLTVDSTTIAYTGDTEFKQENFNKLLSADLIIHECNSFNTSIPNHTKFTELRDASIPQTKRVYLTHLGQSVIDNAEKIQPPFYLAHDNLILQF